MLVPGADGVFVDAVLSGHRVGTLVERDQRYPLELVRVPDVALEAVVATVHGNRAAGR